jgi:PKD repeat protein
MTLSGEDSSDDTSAAGDLTYQWNFKNGGSKVDATGRTVQKKFKRAGFRKVALTVTDEAGNSDTATKRFLVRKLVRCRNAAVEKSGGWRVVENDNANGGSYCDNRGRDRGKDVLTYAFSGPKIVVIHGDAKKGGKAVVFVDGEKRGPLSFHSRSRRIDFGQKLAFRNLGSGDHTIRIVMKRKTGFVEGFVTQG